MVTETHIWLEYVKYVSIFWMTKALMWLTGQLHWCTNPCRGRDPSEDRSTFHQEHVQPDIALVHTDMWRSCKLLKHGIAVLRKKLFSIHQVLRRVIAVVELFTFIFLRSNIDYPGIEKDIFYFHNHNKSQVFWSVDSLFSCFSLPLLTMKKMFFCWYVVFLTLR